MAEERVIRPSLKLVIASYVTTVLILGAAAYGAYGYRNDIPFSPWHLLALILLLIPIRKHIKTRLVTLKVDTDHLTLEAGLFSRTRRTIDLSKVQDVTVRQTLGERILGIGDLTLETAGERSGIVMQAIDRPRAIADLILQRSRELMRQRSQGTGI